MQQPHFLYLVAQACYRHLAEQSGGDVDFTRWAFVFPNRRAGVFFGQYLGRVAREAGALKPFFSPRILTVNNLFEEMSGLAVDDRIDLLFRIYRIYVGQTGSKESFDDFFYWGDMLLNDFDDVDKYMAHARDLFRNISDLKEIDDSFDYLTDEQKEAVRRFWGHFHTKRLRLDPAQAEHDNSRHFIRLWEKLYDIYDALRRELASEGLGYEGMIFREVAERFAATGDDELSEACEWARERLPHFDRVVFVGFNALTTAERTLMRGLRDCGLADFYWDYQAPPASADAELLSHYAKLPLRDAANKASFFMRQNEADFPSLLELDAPQGELRPERIDVVGVSSGVGQTKYVYNLLAERFGTEPRPEADKEPIEITDTAIVLGDENLLLPMLYSIPPSIQKINVTMGYSLKNTPLAGLLGYLAELQYSVPEGRPMFYHAVVESLLRHRYLADFAHDASLRLLADIVRQKLVYIDASAFAPDPLLSLIFRPVGNAAQASDYLLRILAKLQSLLAERRDAGRDDPDARQHAADPIDVEIEFIYHYYTTVERLKGLMEKAGTPMSLRTYFRLVKQLTDGLSVPFQGEPLSGLQVMGVLETRALDFDNLILLSMNEGTFPARKAANSFIPHNLRRGFGLSTTEHQDAVFAYHFYRMILRAKRVTLLYDSRTDGQQTGEPTRYVAQMRYLYGYPLADKVVGSDISTPESVTLTFAKTPEVMRRLAEYLEGGRRTLSASALKTYFACPLRFYIQHVERVREDEEVNDTLQKNDFGTIYHNVMQELYERERGRIVTADWLEATLKQEAMLLQTIRRHFLRMLGQEPAQGAVLPPLEGYNGLAERVLLSYVRRTLEYDRTQAPFTVLHTEDKYKSSMRIEVEGREHRVQLEGTIDRIDRLEKDGKHGESIRVVDYKTGSDDLQFASLESLMTNDKKKGIFQVFFYAMILLDQQLSEVGNLLVAPHIYNLHELFKNKSSKIEKSRPREVVADFRLYEADFRAALRTALEELFDPRVPFRQTADTKACQYCHLKGICKR